MEEETPLRVGRPPVDDFVDGQKEARAGWGRAMDQFKIEDNPMARDHLRRSFIFRAAQVRSSLVQIEVCG